MASILITNIVFAGRTGTEIATFELAYALRGRGHRVAIYSPVLGELAVHARKCGIPVTNRIEHINFVPDVIHGNHNKVLMIALIRFPRTPAIFTCHDSSTTYDAAPPRVRRIMRYAAIDAACRDRLMVEGVPEHEISLIVNGVDLSQYALRSQIAETPQSALIIAKNDANPDAIAAIKKACKVRGIKVTAVGAGVGKVVSDLPVRCRKADVVFAYSRSAVEAAATGAMVILADSTGFGGVMTPEMLATWPNNLISHRHMVADAVTEALVLDALDAYHVDMVQAAAQAVHQKLGLDSIAAVWEQLYLQVIAEAADLTAADYRHDDALLAQYVVGITMTTMDLEQESRNNIIYRYNFYDTKLKTLAGRKTATAIETTGTAGYLMFGPYVTLMEGYYHVKLYGKVFELGSEPKISIDVAINQGGSILAFQFIDELEHSLLANLLIHVSGLGRDMEVRVHVPADAKMELYSLEIVPQSNLIPELSC